MKLTIKKLPDFLHLRHDLPGNPYDITREKEIHRQKILKRKEERDARNKANRAKMKADKEAKMIADKEARRKAREAAEKTPDPASP